MSQLSARTTLSTQSPATQNQEEQREPTPLERKIDELNALVKSISLDSSDELNAQTQALKTFGDEVKKDIHSILENTQVLAMYKKSYRLLKNVHLYRALMVQEVQRDSSGEVVKYGDVLYRGHSLSNVNNGAGSTHSSSFMRVALPSDIEFIEVFGGHNVFYALPKEGNFLYVWGVNTSGCAGSGDTNNIPTPKKIELNFRPKKICSGKSQSTGVQTTLILSEDGFVYGAGTNTQGQLGIGNTINTPIFTQSPYLRDIVDIELISNGTYGYALCIDKEGALWSFGYNGYGNLGHNSTTNITIPAKVTFNKKVVQVSGSQISSYATSFILLEDGSIRGAGYNGHNQLSQSSTSNSSVFIRILKQNGDDLGEIMAIFAASYGGTCFALDLHNNLWSWGYGVQGYGDTRKETNQMAAIALENVQSLDYTDNQQTRAYAKLKNANAILAFGFNTDSSLGIGNATNTREFTPVPLPPQLQDFALYAYDSEAHLCVLCNDSVYSCGTNRDGSINLTASTLQKQH